MVFATSPAASDLPVEPDHPTALLPLGHQTVIEQVMANLVQAGVTDVDLVVCQRPEQLRALLGDGGRWGLRLRWHVVKDPLRPYALLRRQALRGGGRVLLGHADRCPSVPALRDWLASDQMRLVAPDGHWSGWASLTIQHLRVLDRDADREELAELLQSADLPSRLVDEGDGFAISTAGGLQQAQALAGVDVPASWLRFEWGAMSPLARVDASATLVGPVLVGPGCIVEAGASVGPDVLLSRDVVVSTGTRITHSVVLPGSYVGAGLELSHTIVNGARVRHRRLGVESALKTEDALLLDLSAESPNAPGWISRALGALALALAAPALLAHVLSRQLSGRSLAWAMRSVVCGRDPRSGTLRLAWLRCPREQADRGTRRWARLAGLMDVAMGRRSWFGIRPRSPGQWYALRPEWQQMLAGRPIGLLHARAWSDLPALHVEACAAADLLSSVLGPWRRARLLVQR